MTKPTAPTVRHDDDGRVIISGVVLILAGPVHHGSRHTDRAKAGADALTALANGETVAALGAVLSSLLDLMAAGQPAAAAEGLSIGLELAHRITAARAELRAGL